MRAEGPAWEGKRSSRTSTARCDSTPGTRKRSLNSPPAAPWRATTATATSSQAPITRNGWRALLRPSRKRSALMGFSWIGPAGCGLPSPSRSGLTRDCAPAAPRLAVRVSRVPASAPKRDVPPELAVAATGEGVVEPVLPEQRHDPRQRAIAVVLPERRDRRARGTPQSIGVPEQQGRLLAVPGLGGDRSEDGAAHGAGGERVLLRVDPV